MTNLLSDGDLVSVVGFDLAKVRRHRKRGGTSNAGRIHVTYADGTGYRVQQSELRLVAKRVDVVEAFVASRCPMCDESAFLVKSACNHAACVSCWVHWANAIADTFHGSPSSLRCWSYMCDVSINGTLWEIIGRQGHHGASLRRLLFRRRLQLNPLYPPSVQVECRNPGCTGLGYLGSESVMCFVCEDQWVPSDGESEHPIPTGTHDPEHETGTKRCPKCQVLIFKTGGCDHMTCLCRHEFWWTSLMPYRR